MPDMMRKKATPRPTLKPMMALWLSEGRGDAALCEICAGARQGDVGTKEVEWEGSRVVVAW
jgi:hypothetical protein